MNTNRNALRTYANINLQSSIETADPHRLIQIMLGTAIDKITIAKGHLQRGEVAEKGEQIGRAISLVEALKASLDHDGGDISAHLEGLYDYVGRRLLQANVTDNAACLDESVSLLSEIKNAWDALPDMLATPA